MGMVGGIHPNGARYVVQHLVGLSMRGSCYMGAGGPVETGACKLSLVLRQPGGPSNGKTKLREYRWTSLTGEPSNRRAQLQPDGPIQRWTKLQGL